MSIKQKTEIQAMLGYILLFLIFGYFLLVIREGLKNDQQVAYEDGNSARGVSPGRRLLSQKREKKSSL